MEITVTAADLRRARRVLSTQKQYFYSLASLEKRKAEQMEKTRRLYAIAKARRPETAAASYEPLLETLWRPLHLATDEAIKAAFGLNGNQHIIR